MDGIDLARQALHLLQARSLWLVTAESCTGGLLGHWLTEVPGSSASYRGGVIAYSNALKMQLLDVPEALLSQHGAVSAEVARAMAQGARMRLQADVALAVTGIAGPDGGTPEKPVGLVYLALALPAAIHVERQLWPEGDRSLRKQWSAVHALRMLLAAFAAHD